MGIDIIQRFPVHRQRGVLLITSRLRCRQSRGLAVKRPVVVCHLPGSILRLRPAGQLQACLRTQCRRILPPQQRQKDPLRHRPRAVHRLRRHRPGQICQRGLYCQVPQLFRGRGHGRRHNQLFLGTGHSYI